MLLTAVYSWMDASPSQVVAYLTEQAAKAQQAGPLSTTSALWSVLRVLATNNGSLRSQSKLGKVKEQDTPGETSTCCQLLWQVFSYSSRLLCRGS